MVASVTGPVMAMRQEPAYAAAKARIFSARTVQVLNRGDERVMAMARKSAEVVTFGADAPSGGNSYGLLLDNGITWLAWAEDLSPPGRRRRVNPELPAPPPEIHLHRLMPTDALQSCHRIEMPLPLGALS